MSKTTKSVLLIVAVVLLLPIVFYCCYLAFYVPSGDYVWQSVSPDGRYSVTAYIKPEILDYQPMLPGQGGDRTGIAVLRDNQTGKVLETVRVPMVTMTEARYVIWDEDEVAMAPDTIWKLPMKQ